MVWKYATGGTPFVPSSEPCPSVTWWRYEAGNQASLDAIQKLALERNPHGTNYFVPHDGPLPSNRFVVISPIGAATVRIVTFTYKNWRGEIGRRHVVPISVWYGATEWHPEDQWLLKAVDQESGQERDFAMKDISNWEPGFIQDTPKEKL